jgi:hypothetical protein
MHHLATMESYIVIKTINGRRYRYSQLTWREAGRVRTKSVYLGPVDGDARSKGVVTKFLQGLVRKSSREVESEKQMQERVAAEDRQYAKQDRVNDMLTAPTISMEAIGEIAAEQAHSDSAVSAVSDSVGDTDVGDSEGEAGEASP